MNSVLSRAKHRGHQQTVVLDEPALGRADPVTRRGLALWAREVGASLATSTGTNTSNILAAIKSSSETTAWASISAEALQMGPNWGSASSAPIVRGKPADLPSWKLLDEATLFVATRIEAVGDIKAELDGPVQKFGDRLKVLVARQSNEMAKILEAPCLESAYSDRYLFNPLTVRLLTSMVAAFCNSKSKVLVRTPSQHPDRQTRPGRYVHDDSQDIADRDDVFRHLLAEVSEVASVDRTDFPLG